MHQYSVCTAYTKAILTEYMNQSEKEDCPSLFLSSGTILDQPMAVPTVQHRQTSLNVPTITTSTAGQHY